MNEHPAPERLDDFVDGVLAPADRTTVEEHLAACAACAAEVRALRGLLDRLESLPDSVEPTRDHWPSLRAELLRDGPAPPKVVPLAPRRDRVALASPRVGWFGLAAAAAIALVFGLTRPPADRTDPDAPAMAETRPAPASTVPRAALTALEAECASASREVAALYVVRAGRLDPAAADLDDGLRLIDQAILETRQALAADPDDPRLNLLLARRYERKLEMLRRMLRLGHTA